MAAIAMSNNRASEAAGTAAEVFDRTLLHEYSMQNQELAAEILELFLIQMPHMLEALQTAASQAEWNFATHTLKGSAAAIGALRLQNLAAELETMPFPGNVNVRLLRLQALQAAASDLRRAARQAFPGPA
jgi:HPt (histidine-containing phosphotransfer) domain-containing protein